MTPAWREILDRCIPDEAARRPLRPVLLSEAHADLRFLRILIFADGCQQPGWVLRCRGDAAVTAREERVLAELKRRGRRIQPELLGRGRCADMHALLVRFGGGQNATLQFWNEPRHLERLMVELAALQIDLADWAHSAFDPKPVSARELCESAERLRVQPVETEQLVRALDNAREHLARANAAAVPQHGDLWSANVLVEGEKLTVIDWEDFGYVFEPFMDAWTFVLSLCALAGDPEAASLYGRGANASAAECAIRCYALHLGLPAAVGREAFPLAVANFIHLMATKDRMIPAERMSRVLMRYLENPGNFVVGLLK
jgi:aminoglycoside phosphotransferase (APT) family kinase protein